MTPDEKFKKYLEWRNERLKPYITDLVIAESQQRNADKELDDAEKALERLTSAGGDTVAIKKQTQQIAALNLRRAGFGNALIVAKLNFEAATSFFDPGYYMHLNEQEEHE